MSNFDPNGVGIANGNIFGFPVTEQEANIVLIPIPWDATASYGKGTSNGPQAILDASTQLDFYHPNLEKAYETKVFMTEISEEWKKINARLCEAAIEYIDYIENGGKLADSVHFQQVVKEINEAQNALKANLKEKALEVMKAGKIPAVLGGEHSTPLGLLEALDSMGKPFGVLQIDAHADLREAYEGFEQSHASIMFNVLKNCSNVQRLVQVGIRDICQDEVDLIENSNGRVKTFFDWDIKKELFQGKSWHYMVEKIIHHLPECVYISFDIDGLKPYLCPNTGTPVAGGFELEEVNYLFFELLKAGKKIIGFDLNEVGTSEDGAPKAFGGDANVGARALWNLVCLTEKGRRS